MKALDLIDFNSLSREERIKLLKEIAKSLSGTEEQSELFNSEYGPNRQQYISPEERSSRNYGYMWGWELNKD